MNAKEKILYLLGQIETANQLSADNQPCFIDPDAIDNDKLTKLELRATLEKLASDGVIKLLEKPTGNVVRAGKPNYSNYKIEVLPPFDTYYDKIYASNRFGIKNLTFDNYYRIYATAELINQELNIRTDGVATFEADKSTATLWKGVHEKSLSLYHIKQIYSKALGFLKEVGAINSYELYKPSPSSTTQLYKVTASRRKFDAVFLELILNSPNSKTSALTKKLVINKQPKPQPERPDDTASVPQQSDAPTPAPVKAPATKVDIHPLQPNHYHDKTGKLAVSPTVNVSIAVRGKVTRKNRSKYDQCHLMSCLFKSVNTLNNGTTFSTFLGVKYDKNSKTHIRKIRNTVDEINKKVAEKTTAKKLIFIQGERIIVNHSYLKN